MPTLPKGSIRVEQVWKKFRADRTAPLFYDQLLRARRSLSKGGERPYRWVLKDVSVNVEPGGTLGLIGINGSVTPVRVPMLQQPWRRPRRNRRF